MDAAEPTSERAGVSIVFNGASENQIVSREYFEVHIHLGPKGNGDQEADVSALDLERIVSGVVEGARRGSCSVDED